MVLAPILLLLLLFPSPAISQDLKSRVQVLKTHFGVGSRVGACDVKGKAEGSYVSLEQRTYTTPGLNLSKESLENTGCYWTEPCQSKWFGGCGAGHIVTDQSDDCNGRCEEPSYPPCLPFHTHFHCCKPENPQITDRCTRCKNKLDFGDEFVCCNDCSDPYLIDKSAKFGYCKTGAELAVQLKPQEILKWVTGPWMKCSSPCDGGIRYRDVGCFGSTEDTSIEHYPVDDSKCSAKEMPARQEPCNLRSCTSLSARDASEGKQSGMSGWLITLLVLLGLVAVGGLVYAGYIFYKRRISTPSGIVYIMLEGYT